MAIEDLKKSHSRAKEKFAEAKESRQARKEKNKQLSAEYGGKKIVSSAAGAMEKMAPMAKIKGAMEKAADVRTLTEKAEAPNVVTQKKPEEQEYAKGSRGWQLGKLKLMFPNLS